MTAVDQESPLRVHSQPGAQGCRVSNTHQSIVWSEQEHSAAASQRSLSYVAADSQLSSRTTSIMPNCGERRGGGGGKGEGRTDGHRRKGTIPGARGECSIQEMLPCHPSYCWSYRPPQPSCSEIRTKHPPSHPPRQPSPPGAGAGRVFPGHPPPLARVLPHRWHTPGTSFIEQGGNDDHS